MRGRGPYGLLKILVNSIFLIYLLFQLPFFDFQIFVGSFVRFAVKFLSRFLFRLLSIPLGLFLNSSFSSSLGSPLRKTLLAPLSQPSIMNGRRAAVWEISFAIGEHLKWIWTEYELSLKFSFISAPFFRGFPWFHLFFIYFPAAAANSPAPAFKTKW